jgi:Bacterial Ig-like domain (group 3)/FG-GAP-like repeat
MKRTTVWSCLVALLAAVLSLTQARAADAPDPRFLASHVESGGSVPEATAIGDVTGDGRADLIVANGAGGTVATDDRVFGFAQGSDGTLPDTPSFWVVPSATSSNHRLAVGDLNDDGHGDLAVANVDGDPASGIDVFLESGGTLTGPTTLGPVAVRDLAVGDMNGDGLDDLAYTRVAGTFAVAVRAQLPLGGFAPEAVVAAGVPAPGLSLDDVDGDGLTDFAIDGSANETVPVFLQDPTLHTFARTDVPLPTTVTRAFLADVNDDGKADLVVARTGGAGVAWAAGVGNGTFGSFTSVGGPGFAAKEVGDLNDDGLVDLATFNNRGKLRIYVQPSTGGLSSPCVFPAPAVSGSDAATSIGDLTGDGAGGPGGGAGPRPRGGGATVFTQLVGGQRLPTSLSLVASTASIAFGSSVTLSGALSNPAGGCVPGGSVTIHQRDPDDVETVVDTVPLGGDLTFSTDVVPPGAGSYSYWATWAGDGTHDAATSGERDLAVVKTATSLTLTTSTSVVVYGRSVTLRATLDGSSGAPSVDFYRIVGGTKTKIGSDVVNSDGVAKLAISPSRNASYQARFAGSAGLSPSASGTRTVSLRVVVVGSMVRADAVKGGVAIYDCCKAFYRFLVKPKHPGGIVRVAVQYLSGGTWHKLPAEVDTFKLGPDGTDQIFLHVAGGKGYTFRVRSHFASDGDHLGAWSTYVRFRFR